MSSSGVSTLAVPRTFPTSSQGGGPLLGLRTRAKLAARPMPYSNQVSEPMCKCCLLYTSRAGLRGWRSAAPWLRRAESHHLRHPGPGGRRSPSRAIPAVHQSPLPHQARRQTISGPRSVLRTKPGGHHRVWPRRRVRKPAERCAGVSLRPEIGGCARGRCRLSLSLIHI